MQNKSKKTNDQNEPKEQSKIGRRSYDTGFQDKLLRTFSSKRK